MSARWYNNSWKYRKKLSGILRIAKKASLEAPLYNYPFMLSKTEKDLRLHAQKSGADLLFTSGDGCTKLSHDIRHWDATTGRIVAYVKIPVISHKDDTSLYLYYGNPCCECQDNPSDVWSDYSHRLVFHKDPSAPLDASDNYFSGPDGTPIVVSYYLAQKRILEDMFGLEWFEDSHPKVLRHPAYKRWCLCNSLISGKGRFDLNKEANLLPEIANLILDTLSFVYCSKGDIGALKLGSLSNYGDEPAQKRIRKVIQSHEQYLDVQSELQLAAWHISKEHSVRAFEIPGVDHEIGIPDWDRAVLSDSKRFAKNSPPNRIRDILKKANRQIKRHPRSGYGIVAIDLTEKVPIREDVDDEFPQELHAYREVATDSLTNFYSSITAVLLVWNEISIIGMKDSGNLLMIVLRTRSALVQHQNPIREFYSILNLEELKVVRTISFDVRVDKTRLNSP